MSNTLKLTLITFLFLVFGSYLIYKGSNFSLVENENLVFEQTTPTPIATSSGVVRGVTSDKVEEIAVVKKVIDGDTIEVEYKGTSAKLRYIGINTPETVDPRKGVECFGREASFKNKELLEGAKVILEKDISETDRFGRLLRYVYIELDDGRRLFVNDYLAREGYAYASAYPPDIKYQKKLEEAQEFAKVNKKGLWNLCQT